MSVSGRQAVAGGGIRQLSSPLIPRFSTDAYT
jgi:hypothetical protein